MRTFVPIEGADHFDLLAPVHLAMATRLAETAGRRETLLETFRAHGVSLTAFAGWQAFMDSDLPCGITVAALEQGEATAA